MESFEERLMSFESWPASNHVSPQKLAAAGFYYLNRGDEVRCAFCKVEIMRWRPGDDPLADHKRWAPHCKYVCQIDGEEKLRVGEDECGSRSGDNAPKHPAFVSYDARIETYKNKWPRALTQTPHQLASAGFYYTGIGDAVLCFYNDCRLSEWNAGDDPWREHARWFAECPYVRKFKGLDYIQKIATEACLIRGEESATSSTEPTRGLSVKDEKAAQLENEELVCKICFEGRRNVCFMPCGHVVACRECSLNVERCPLCRDKFTSIQRLFYA
ncbi:IAP-3 [Agrotis segetum nucleopolyhedrovirus A]|uniref:IAP-3 n=1 Tax=Agrotis segetum nuclear polyhedrosis virus TaxID=1962501 RepID=Q287F3_NPVAS|nr:IAP-3 [Agrotis segetum nucleopolyhedrovirus A]AAZ38285.1 IAP-3 [Agrotis segetum nucleopolyhedrovirus A]